MNSLGAGHDKEFEWFVGDVSLEVLHHCYQGHQVSSRHLHWMVQRQWIDFFCLLTFALAAVLGTTMAFSGASTPLESVVVGVIAVGVFGGQLHFHLTSAGTALVSSDTGSVAVAVAFAVQMDHIVGIAREGERLGYAAV